jgi:hypothetical protein
LTAVLAVVMDARLTLATVALETLVQVAVAVVLRQTASHLALVALVATASAV